jgi:hypothetical protein
MLPIFMKNKEKAGNAGLIVKTRTPDENQEAEQDKEYTATDCAKDILSAIKSEDAEGLAESLKELFKLADKEPHEEGPHTSKHTYDDQNQKASEE